MSLGRGRRVKRCVGLDQGLRSDFFVFSRAWRSVKTLKGSAHSEGLGVPGVGGVPETGSVSARTRADPGKAGGLASLPLACPGRQDHEDLQKIPVPQAAPQGDKKIGRRMFQGPPVCPNALGHLTPPITPSPKNFLLNFLPVQWNESPSSEIRLRDREQYFLHV